MTGFYEDDEPVDKIRRLFDSGPKGVTRRIVGWQCQHMNMTASGIIGRPTTTLCDCELQPIYA